MKLKSIIPAFIFLLMLFSCSSQNKKTDERSEAEFTAKAEQAVQNLSGTLVSVLTTKIDEEGTVAAINYCSEVALELTDSISKAEGVIIKRVSHRYRNPANAAEEKEIELIKNYISQIENGEKPEAQVISQNNHFIYYSPIIIGMPTCLKCHGKPNEDIEENVLLVLNEKYPGDIATGFSMGELRGLFKVVGE
jgi:hypothetical protein